MGVDAVLDGGVLRRQAKGVEPHGMEHVVALHPSEPGMNVGWGHGIPVADVEVSGGIGEHGELVPLGSVGVFLHAVQPVGGPPFLPLGLYLCRVVSQGHLATRSPEFQLRRLVIPVQSPKLPRPTYPRNKGPFFL